jgi:hypothetical protein
MIRKALQQSDGLTTPTHRKKWRIGSAPILLHWPRRRIASVNDHPSADRRDE